MLIYKVETKSLGQFAKVKTKYLKAIRFFFGSREQMAA